MKAPKVVRKCERCNKPFSVGYDSPMAHEGTSALCRECQQKDIEQERKGDTFVCKTCDAAFTMTKKHQLYFIANGLVLPKRCPACRVNHKRAMDACTIVKEMREEFDRHE